MRKHHRERRDNPRECSRGKEITKQADVMGKVRHVRDMRGPMNQEELQQLVAKREKLEKYRSVKLRQGLDTQGIDVRLAELDDQCGQNGTSSA